MRARTGLGDVSTGAELVAPGLRTIGIQTDYRDSEAQTDPYSPDFVVRPKENPELLMLNSLKWGHGLPAALPEVIMIERMREKRAFEASMPPLNDVSQREKRRKMMDELELREWSYREEEIAKLQEARLAVLLKLLKDREESNQKLNSQRLDKLWTKKQRNVEAKIRVMRKEYMREIRKLVARSTPARIEGKLERRDLVKDYTDAGSQSFAPLTRIGVFPDRFADRFIVKSHFLTTYNGLCALEQTLPRKLLNPSINAPRKTISTREGFVKRQYREEQMLDDIFNQLQTKKQSKLQIQKPLRFLERLEKPRPRPPTPCVEPPQLVDEEDQELAIITLQKLLRGRAVQTMMFQARERRRELIAELRSTHALQEAEKDVKKRERNDTLALQKQRDLRDMEETFINQCLDEAAGTNVGEMLDFLSKELIRLEDERSRHAFAMLAERQRRMREAEESGRRQIEERRRREWDEIFKQTVKTHQDSVDTYLEDIIVKAVDDTAQEQAKLEVRELARRINDAAYSVEKTRTEFDSEEIVSGLIHEFLYPNVNTILAQNKADETNRRFLAAAHHEIYGTTSHMTGVKATQSKEQKGSSSEKGEQTQE